tara:strand:+ start:15470 stop:16279 length:810 start_codon:yes stop_codon:yes gene_type:complete
MLKLKKSLGQNFLIDKNIINKIASLEIIENQTVFEIGPGSGNLTESIIKKKPRIITLIEKDKRLCEILKKKFKLKKNYKIINNDILSYNLDSQKKYNAIVFGNLPYNISTQILAKFISVNQWPPFYRKIIFMFQKEVADRILAKTNTREYGRITVLSNLRLDVIDKFNISKKCFFPIPKVDSKIIVFQPKFKIKFKILDIKNLEKVTHVFFSNKRKMINKAFSKLFLNYDEIAQKLNINLNLRPSELSCEDYYRITECYEKLIKKPLRL